SPPMHSVRAGASHAQAIHAIAELLEKLRIESMFVGNVARSAWLGSEVEGGAIDVLALMNAAQKNQIAMMASSRGFRVEQSEIEQSEELDLVPLNHISAGGDVRVHVLLASNALYGRMMNNAKRAQSEERTIRVDAAEDLALMLLVGEAEADVRELTMLQEIERSASHYRLKSSGLGAAAE